MYLEKLDHWLYQSYLIRYSTIVGILIPVIWAIIFIWIMPISDKLQQKIIDSQTLIQNIELVEQQIANFPSLSLILEENKLLNNQLSELTSFSFQDKDIFANTLIESNLRLVEFSKENMAEISRYHFNFSGTFNDFFLFLQQLNHQSISPQIDMLFITRDDNKLFFLLGLSCKHQQVFHE